MVKGKFTYLNVLDLIARIESTTGEKLTLERKRIEYFFNNAKKRGISFKKYRQRIYRLLRKKAFGKRYVLTAFHRMPKYTKIVVVWDVLVFLSIINIGACVAAEKEISALKLLYGSIFGLMPALFMWFFCHVTLNNALKKSTNKRIKDISSVPFRIAMAQFWAITGGWFWRDVYWVDGPRGWSNNYHYYSGSSFGSYGGWSAGDFGGFGGGGFGGGGAGGSW